MKTPTKGSLLGILTNAEDLYDGDLAHYFRAVFFNAQNLSNPYHNFRHIFHVLWLCNEACRFYAKKGEPLTKRQVRNLFIAAMFHDFNHTGMSGNDDLNIEFALRGLEKHLMLEDKEHLPEITGLIKATQFPYAIPSSDLDLSGQIIRDADMCQALSVAWMQQVVIGLADEWDKKPIDVLRMQAPFLQKLEFLTEWAQQAFDLEEKIDEAKGLLELLEHGTSPALATKK